MTTKPRRSTPFGTRQTDRRTFLRATLGAFAAGDALTVVHAHAEQTTPVTPPRADVASAIRVYPPHGTRTASPSTEISFRETSQQEVRNIRVTGSRSGGHSGLFMPHTDERGVSFAPDAPFEPGESVTVSTERALPHGIDGAIEFQISSPAPRMPSPSERETMQPDAEPQMFRSRPDLQPPVINVTTEATNTAPGHIFVAPRIPDGQSGAMILDSDGELVWYGVPALNVSEVNDFRVQEHRGKPVLTWSEGAGPVGYGFGHFVVADSAYNRMAAFSVGNGFPGGDVHEFLLTPQGTALVIIYHPVRWNLSPVRGPINGIVLDGIVQEIEIETGRVLFEWHSLDHINIDETYHPLPKQFGRPLDYVHVNSIGLDPDGGIVISGRHTNAIYKIDRSTGDIVWRLNGRRSDFRMGPNTPFAYQHDARMHENGRLTLFDNTESNPRVGGISRGMEMDLDEHAMRATLVQEYIHPTEILSVSQGNMQMLPNGNAFVGWGSAPVFSELGPDSDLLFNGRFPRGVMSYRAYRMPWTGLPEAPPEIAAQIDTGGALTVYASWNGATDVAAWRVLAGPSVHELEPAKTTLRTGFETTIQFESNALYVLVQALDSSRRVMGTSDVLRVT